MPRFNIIVLEQINDGSARAWHVALWADVPVARQPFYANANIKTSAWNGATAADITNLQIGSVVEKVITYSPDGAKTIPQMEADLQTIWTAYSSEIASFNPWTRYGSTWDGTTWVGATVA